MRQWIVGGVGGRPVDRRRDLEFAPVDESDAVLAALDPAAIESRVTTQGVDVTRMGAIYHVVEHFAMHTGQILWIANGAHRARAWVLRRRRRQGSRHLDRHRRGRGVLI